MDGEVAGVKFVERRMKPPPKASLKIEAGRRRLPLWRARSSFICRRGSPMMRSRQQKWNCNSATGDYITRWLFMPLLLVRIEGSKKGQQKK